MSEATFRAIIQWIFMVLGFAVILRHEPMWVSIVGGTLIWFSLPIPGIERK